MPTFLLLLADIPVAHAQLDLPPVMDDVASGASVVTFICTVVFSWVFTALIFASIALALYAAFTYMTAGGDAAKVTKANKTLLFVAAGVAVAILARTLPVAVGSLVSGSVQLDPCAASPGTGPAPHTQPTT